MRHMQSTTTTWGASYKGVGLAILQLADDSFQGVTEDGYTSPPFPDVQEALADITAYIDLWEGGTLHA